MDATFEDRFQAARAALLRRYPWSAPTLLALRPVEKDRGTLSVDPWSRLYFNRSYADALTDAAFVGALWHETNHLLRRHADRFVDVESSTPGLSPRRGHKLANLAADAEINADLRGKVTLPDNVVFPETFGEPAGRIAEDYFGRLVKDAAEDAERRAKQRAEDAEREEDEDTDDDTGEDDEDGTDTGDTEEDEEDDGTDDGGSGSDESPADDSSEDGDASDGDEDADADDGAMDDDSGGGESEEDADDDSDDDGDDASSGEDGDAGSELDGDGSSEDDDEEDDDGCGSASGGNADGELPEPDDDEQAEAEARAREQAEAVLDAENNSPPGRGPGQSVVDAARALLGHSAYDWRATFAKVVRAAFEQATDEAEEYSFRRPSRRASAADPGIIPGSYRPTPLLSVVVDGSGSMDADKVTSALTEVAGVLERIAIPSFTGHIWSDGSGAYGGNTGPDGCDGHRTIAAREDAARLLEDYVAGGTAMLPGVVHALNDANGYPEVVVVLTDCEDGSWTVENPCPGVPVIVGGINAAEEYIAALPSWIVYVDVMPELDADGNPVRRSRRSY